MEDDILQTERNISALESSDCLTSQISSEYLALRALYNRHFALLRQNSLKWAQMASLLWLNNGDFNTKFFHNFVRVRSHHNRIAAIKDNFGNLHTHLNGISDCLIDFYSHIWSSSRTPSVSVLCLEGRFIEQSKLCLRGKVPPLMI